MGIISSHLKTMSCNLFDDRYRYAEFMKDRYRYADFMKGGPCKEAYMNCQNWMYKGIPCIKSRRESRENHKKLNMCIVAHPDYYQPLLDLNKSTEKFFEERLEKDIMHSDTPNDEESHKFFAALTEDSCKESFRDWAVNCVLLQEKNNEEDKCYELFNRFMECIDAHPDHPLCAVKKATEEHMDKEANTLFRK